MKLTILTDNNTLTDRYFLAEPGLSIYIEEQDKKILFDTGYSDVFIKNAFKIGVDLKSLDYLVFSHGHNDHTNGLIPLFHLYQEWKEMHIDLKIPEIIAHPSVFNSKYRNFIGYIGAIVSKDALAKAFNLNFNSKPFWLTDKLVFLGEIPRILEFEKLNSSAKTIIDNEEVIDPLIDDSALAYKSVKGLVIITGCSHSGICNIVEYAKFVCNERKIHDIIGGFHLLKATDEKIDKTLEYLKKQQPKKIHPCHCTDLAAKMAFGRSLNVKEVGVGLCLEFE